MDLFLRLCLAHLIGDFILQFEELYRLKVRSRLGHFLHAAVHAGTSLVLAFPYSLHFSLWLFVAAISTIHYFQDQIKYRLQKRSERLVFACFIIDQILHFFFISAIFFFPISRKAPGGDPFTLSLIAFITAAFAGGYFLHALRKSYLSGGTRSDHFITSPEMIHGIIERGGVAFIFLFSMNPLLWIASISIGLLRLLSRKLRNGTDFLLNFSFSALVGLFFRHLLEIL